MNTTTMRLRTMWDQKWVQEVLVMLWFVMLAFVLMGPVVTHFGQYSYGGRGDNSGTLYSLWYRRYLYTHDPTLTRDGLLYYPLGDLQAAVPWLKSVSLETLIHPVKLYYSLTLPIMHEVVVFNLLYAIYIVLSGASMYWLVQYVTGHRVAAVVAGSLYMWAPSHLAEGWLHIHYSGVHWMVLYILALIHFGARPAWGRAVIAGILLGVTITQNPYYGFFGAQIFPLFVGVLALHRIVTAKWNWRAIMTTAGQFAVIVGLSGFFVAMTFGSIIRLNLPTLFHRQPGVSHVSAGSVETAAPVELVGEIEAHYRHSLVYYSLAAFPWDFFVPSRHHPVFGSINEGIIESVRQLGVFHTASRFDDVRPDWLSHTDGVQDSRQHYLGLANLALAGFGLWMWRKEGSLSAGRDIGILLFLSLLMLAPWLAGPPELPVGLILERLFRRDIPLDRVVVVSPSYWLSSLAPQFRIYARTGTLAVLSVVALAGVGLASLLRRMQRRWQAVLVVAGTLGLGLFEFATIPPFHFVEGPVVWPRFTYIENQTGDFAIVDIYTQTDSFYSGLLPRAAQPQRYHGKPVLDQILWDHIAAAETDQARVLSGLDVRYVVTERDESPGFSEGLQLVDATGQVSIYEVRAEPVPIMVYADQSFRGGTWQSQSDWTWRVGGETLYVLNDARAELCLTAHINTESATIPFEISVPDVLDDSQYDVAYDQGELSIQMRLAPGLHPLTLNSPPGEAGPVEFEDILFGRCRDL